MNHISDTATIADDVQIGRFCVIGSGVRIGPGSILDDFVVVKDNAVVGADCYLGTYTKIGARAVLGEEVKITAFGEIRDDCTVGARSTFGSRCTLSAGTVVGEDVIVKYGFVATDTPKMGEQEKQTCVLMDGSQYGANVAIMPGVTVGERAVIGACSQVRDQVGDDEVWFGNPAKKFK